MAKKKRPTSIKATIQQWVKYMESNGLLQTEVPDLPDQQRMWIVRR